MPYGTYDTYGTYAERQGLMDGPRPIDEEIGTDAFRKEHATYLARANQGQVVLITKRVPKGLGGTEDLALLISPTLWDALGRVKRDRNGLTTWPNGAGGYLTRDQLARYLQVESERIGEETYQLTAGEMRLIKGLIAEIAGRYADEPLGQLAGEWVNRLGTRTAPTVQ